MHGLKIEISHPFRLSRNQRFAWGFLKLMFIAGCAAIAIFLAVPIASWAAVEIYYALH